MLSSKLVACMAAYGPQFLLGSTFVGRDCQKDSATMLLTGYKFGIIST